MTMKRTNRNVPSTCKAEMPGRVADLYWRMLAPNIRRVLDLGCGYGGFGKRKPGESVIIGVDRDPLVLAAAGIHYDQVFLADLEHAALEFAPESFDGVLARDILEHLPEPWSMVSEIRRVLKPGGTVIASVPMAKASVVWSDYTHVRGFTKNAIRSLFEDGGFRVHDVFPMGGYSLSNKMRMTRFMPLLMKIPGAGLLAVSYHLVAEKPMENSQTRPGLSDDLTGAEA